MAEIMREPYAVVYREESGFKDVYGGAGGHVFVECMRIAPAAFPSKRVIVFSHPVGGGSFLPLVTALAKAGHHIIYVNPRYRGNDSALIMEKCVADLGAALLAPSLLLSLAVAVCLGGTSVAVAKTRVVCSSCMAKAFSSRSARICPTASVMVADPFVFQRSDSTRRSILAAGRRSAVCGALQVSCSVNQSVKQSLGGALLAHCLFNANCEPNRTRPSFAVVSVLEPLVGAGL
jgi:hypothetical protein